MLRTRRFHSLTIALVFPAFAQAQDPPSYPRDLDATVLTGHIDAHLAAAQAAVDRLLSTTSTRTALNTLRPLDDAKNHLWSAQGLIDVAIHMHPDTSVRAAGLRLEPRIARFHSELRVDPRVARAVAELDTSALTAEERLITRRLRRDFRRGGAHRDDAQRETLRSNFDAMDRLSTRFARNIAEDSTVVLATDDELSGMPPDWIANHSEAEDGRVILTTQYPDFFPVISYASNRSLRQRMVLAFFNRGWPANVTVLDSLLRTREATAQLLGYANWASYQAEPQMTGSVDSVRSFLSQVHEAASAAVARRSEAYLKRLQRDDPSITALQFGDANYAAELIRRERFALDGRDVRAYFPTVRVKEGLLEIMAELFGLEFRPAVLPTWHPSVEAWEAFEDGKLLGRFYLDLYPRPGKYQHAAVFGLQSGIAGRQLPEFILITNFPGGGEGDPGLMEHGGGPGSVRTFFHEFGHLLHGLLASREYVMSGWPDEQDFVEAPSQMLEEWAWHVDVLQRFARHHETGEPIPRELVERMHAANALDRPMQAAMQSMFSEVSLVLHENPAAHADPEAIASAAGRRHMRMTVPDGSHWVTSFDHIGMNGYSAVYYTYLWSQVIAKDLWSVFDREQPLDPAPARRYRDIILRPGGARPAGELITEFLGRPFGFESWRHWLEAGSGDVGESEARSRGSN